LIFFQKQSKIINRLKLGKNMAITDINISEQLETGAPSIKYEGDQGPQDPRKEQALALLKEEYMQYVFEQRDMEAPVMSFEEWYQSVYQASKMGVQAPQEQITTEETMMREPAAFGGIMDRHGRRRYGFGSIKDRIRKLIPNEVARAAEVAAPFVAPFNPIAGGLMAGVGGFDRTGSIGKSLKSGLMNYGLGQAARYIGWSRNLQKDFKILLTKNHGVNLMYLVKIFFLKQNKNIFQKKK
jgi:hypothetical protein